MLLAVAAAGRASADDALSCTAARPDRIDALSAIGLEPVGFPAELAELAADAAELWNSAPCDATARPRFLVGAPGERTLVVRWIDGTAAAPNVCGSFSRGEIRLYAFARDPERGRLERCGEGGRLVEILAHELGHALGLYDQRAPQCSTRIMGQLVRRFDGSIAAREIHGEECRAVAQRFLTLTERLQRTFQDDPQLATIGPASAAWGLQ
jgi:hypothetical protein